MNDNHPSPTSRKGHQDLLHALILLGTVPLLFFAALKLVEKSTDVPIELGPTVIQDVKDKVSPVIDRFIPPKPPPPGEAWLRELAVQEQRIVEFRSTPNVVAGRIDQLQQRLTTLRHHIEQHMDAVPSRIRDDHSLGAALLRLAAEIDQSVQSVSNQQAGFHWKQAYAASEAEERTQYSLNVARAFERLTTELKEPHRVELAAITRESRDLKDQIQRVREQQSDIQRRVERELARQDRLRAFEVDRAEIQRLLSPFITPGYMQLRTSERDWVKTPEAQPVSWRDLERLGSLVPTKDGLETLGMIGSQPFHSDLHRRPRGSFPAPADGVIRTPREIEATKRAQQLLKKHSQTLIEERLLSP